jgi:hypothetical protein
MHPYLARFENDWATAEIVKQYIRNRRKHVTKQSKEQAESNPRKKVPHIDELDEEEDANEGKDGGEGGSDGGEGGSDGEEEDAEA